MDDAIDIDAWQQSELRKQLASASLLQGASPVPPAIANEATKGEGKENNATQVSASLPQTPSASNITSGPEPHPASAIDVGSLPPSGIETALNPDNFCPIPGLDNLVQLWYAMEPNTELYDWQAQELYRISGYVNGTPSGPRIHWSSDNPLFATYVCCNNSGKDIVLIRTTAIGLPLLYPETLVVITSASHEQLKHQTNTPLERGLRQLAKRFGHALYSSVEFHHRCDSRGSEIKLFATDEAGRAEGWHPRCKGGRLVLLPNECKTVPAPISTALDRCHGVSHRIEVSSPGPRSGWFYQHWRQSAKYELGATPQPWRYFSRKITVDDCPHINREAVRLAVELNGEESFLVQTSFRANFHEESVNVAIPAAYVDNCEYVRPVDGEISLALDCAAGGDETVAGARCGNHIADWFAFRNPDIEASCDIIDERLKPWKKSYSSFRVDDSGLGRGYSDGLTRRGWNITKCHNQSAARLVHKYVNFGAECYGHCANLFQAKKIPAPKDEMMRSQLITRKKLPHARGLLKLQSKLEIKAEGGSSPDRSDFFTLLFYDYQPGFDSKPPPPPEDPHADVGRSFSSFAEAAKYFRRNPNAGFSLPSQSNQLGLYAHEQYYRTESKRPR